MNNAVGRVARMADREKVAEALVEAWRTAGTDFLRNREEEQQPYITGPLINVAERWLADAAIAAMQEERCEWCGREDGLAYCPHGDRLPYSCSNYRGPETPCGSEADKQDASAGQPEEERERLLDEIERRLQDAKPTGRRAHAEVVLDAVLASRSPAVHGQAESET